ncbi:hypothetical protein AB0939_24770 [Streptomyces sp. NPDC006990]|uniref:hypothetical protein n=1 Tax=Streptomyces sp. NPDC006990 TaxID=3154481 RepID=UPI003454554F
MTKTVEGFGGFAKQYEQGEKVSAHHGNFWKVLLYGQIGRDRAVMFDLAEKLEVTATSENGRVLDALAHAQRHQAARDEYISALSEGPRGGHLLRHAELAEGRGRQDAAGAVRPQALRSDGLHGAGGGTAHGRRDNGRVGGARRLVRAAASVGGRGGGGRDGGVLRLLDQVHWAEGWLYQLTGRVARRMDKDTLDNMAWLLGEILADCSKRAAEAVAADRAKGHGPPATAEVTRVLTRVVLSFKDELVRDTPLAPFARAYKELRLPVEPDGKGRYGRADVVVWVPGGPNFVIEIDSAPNPASVEKLVFARGTGAFPLWVRFGKGDIEKIDGVMVLDIRDTVRGVCEAEIAR